MGGIGEGETMMERDNILRSIIVFMHTRLGPIRFMTVLEPEELHKLLTDNLLKDINVTLPLHSPVLVDEKNHIRFGVENLELNLRDMFSFSICSANVSSIHVPAMKIPQGILPSH